MDATAIIGVISAATALAASVTGPLATIHVGRSQFRAAVLSTNRQRWIDAFRELVSEFCAEIAGSVQSHGIVRENGMPDPAIQRERIVQFERIVLTSTQIRLMVNPLEEEHRALLDAMEALIAMLRMALPGQDVQPDAEAAGRQIIAMSRAILRQEWQRVQRGA